MSDNIPITSRKRRRLPVVDNFFSEIDTPNKAYSLGMLYSDGYIDEKRYQIEISLQEKDVEILKKLNRMVNLEKDLCYRKPKKHYKTGNICSGLFRLYIKNKKISEDLIRLGLRQRKSFNVEWPNFIRGDLVWHFIRGYFDGNGSICIKTNGNGVKYGACSIISSVFFIDGLVCFLNNSGFSVNIENENHYSRPMKTLIINRMADIKMFHDKMYRDCGEIFMDRKRSKFKDLFDLKGVFHDY